MGLLDNNLLWSYLSGAGAAIAEGKQPASALDAITQRNIQAQSAQKAHNAMLAQLMGMTKSGATEGKGNSITVTPDGLKVNVPSAAIKNENTDSLALLGQLLATGNTPAPAQDNGQVQSPQPAPQIQQPVNPQMNQPVGNQMMPSLDMQSLARQLLNPSISPLNLSNADLAGLGASEFANALGGAQNTLQLHNQSISQAANILFNDVQMREANERIRKSMLPPAPEAEDQEYFISLPNGQPISLRQWKGLDSKTQAYLSYSFLQKQMNPNEPIVSPQEFYMSADESAQIQFIRMAMKDPEFFKTAKALKGGTQVTVNAGDRAMDTKIGTERGTIAAPTYYQEVEKRVDEDPMTYSRDAIDNMAVKMKLDPKDSKARRLAMENLKRTRTLEIMDRDIKATYKDRVVEFNGKGWYIVNENGTKELIVRNPYAN